ncbi:hypothetical protein Q7C_1986 [Methylophaga frappieri]|uniref:Uncharacterized protein n=1 Tax=Methylophaga frappieri (strain ATCC BAA-2434 / DSM 25690 / JAM7) TaxID=754477 RepID=I1YJN3_METFJ|nr:hypothetical protein Q7C_1986 [Methylophaga frappieri]
MLRAIIALRAVMIFPENFRIKANNNRLRLVFKALSCRKRPR